MDTNRIYKNIGQRVFELLGTSEEEATVATGFKGWDLEDYEQLVECIYEIINCEVKSTQNKLPVSEKRVNTYFWDER